MLPPITQDGWLTLVVIVMLAVMLLRDTAAPDILILAASASLALLGVITPQQAFAGFANPGMLTVAMLYVVVAGLRETGVLDQLGALLLGRARSREQVLRRMTVTVLPLSAFVNNTPVVAMFVPMVLDWCRRHEVSPSALLIALSYLAILGGICTLIGTSANLVVHGLLVDRGMPGLGLFEIGAVGVPCAAAGVGYLLLRGRRLVPERIDPLVHPGEARREYLVEMMVLARCPLAGKAVEEAGLRHRPGLFLVAVDRGGSVISPLDPALPIAAGDRLLFSGTLDGIIDLERVPGLVPVAERRGDPAARGRRGERMCEVVISPFPPLVADVRRDRPLRTERAWVALAVFTALIAVMAGGLVPVVVAAALAAALMVLSGCLSPAVARASIDWQVLITIAAAFGVGSALQSSGLVAVIVALANLALGGAGPLVLVAATFALGMALTALVTNSAAVILLFPFCIEAATLADADPRPFVIALALSASTSFASPIGYQTNMMVYGPGGLRFTDFVRAGAPLSVLIGIVALVVIPVVWPP